MNSNDSKEKTDATTKNHERIFLLTGINRFPERLREAMVHANIPSNNQLAKKTYLSESTIRKYLKRESYPTLDRLALIANACSCSVSWLATGDENGDYMPSNINEHIVDINEQRHSELERVLSYLSEEQRDKFMKVIYTRGISAILQLDDDLDAKFLTLTEEEKTRLLSLHEAFEEAKKGAPEASSKHDVTNPTQNQVG
ncbi:MULTISPECIES: helix-turn-helix domain-containing protein [Providencia]|uniref:helix-turn-helix domain-containing protein n=1 Tax=Providencia TaxID=586 RepID=UPI00140DCEE6|nr:helix-turn-helix transcriptional regulator [Providencia sp. M-27]